jgi:hypothetical protein
MVFYPANIFKIFFEKIFPGPENFSGKYFSRVLDHGCVQDSGSCPPCLPWQHFTSEENTLPENKGWEGE